MEEGSLVHVVALMMVVGPASLVEPGYYYQYYHYQANHLADQKASPQMDEVKALKVGNW